MSLSPGHILTPTFEINTKSRYRIASKARGGFGHSSGPSESPYYEYFLPDLGSSWTLSNRGRVVARGTGQLCDEPGEFDAGSGRYVLDVTLSQDGSSFNSRSPRLIVTEVGGVRESADAQGHLASLSLVVLLILGAGAIISSTVRRRHEKRDALLKAWSLTLPGCEGPSPCAAAGSRLKAIVTRRPTSVEYYYGDRRALARRPLSGLSSASLIMAVLSLLAVVLSCCDFSLGPIPVGLNVRLLRPGVTGERSPGIQPVLVEVRLRKEPTPDARMRDTRLFVNRTQISRDNFEAVLQKELNLRPPDWPVYLEGYPELEWHHVVQVIDVIRKLHAQVVLLTRVP